MSQYLSEAFKRLDTLNEETFSVTDNGLEDFMKFSDEDEFEDTIDVIDPEAETEEDLQDSYVGKVILDCCVCHSKLYKDVEDVVIEDDFANVNEECPFCYTTDGFKVIGQVATFGGEDVDNEESSEDDKAEKEKDDKLEESAPSRRCTKKMSEFLPTPPGIQLPTLNASVEDKEEDEEDLDEFLDANITLDARGFGGKDNNVSVLGGKLPTNEGIFDKFKKNSEEDKKSDNYDNYYVIVVNDKGRYRYTKMDPNRSKAALRQAIEGMPTDTLPKDCKYEIIRYGEAKELVGKEFMNSWGKPFHEGIFSKKKKPEMYTISVKEADGTYTAVHSFDKKEDAVRFKDEYEKEHPDAKYVLHTGKQFESISESVNNVNVETDEDVINVATDDNGKVTVTTEPKTTDVDNEEVITPLEPEVHSEITDNVGDGEEIEIDMDEFDEESFDELGEGYLKKVYENVNSFKTSNVSFIKDNLVLEGVINFNSGKNKKTRFVFGIREATKSGKVRFIGENKEIARGKKSFTVTGRVENKKFLSESFNYNYGARNAQGKAQRLYGTIKTGKKG